MTASAGDTFSSTSSTKADLRKLLRQARRRIASAARAQAARSTARRLLRMRRIRRARGVAIYLPMIHELDTWPLITRLLRDGKQLFAPHVGRNKTMSLVPLKRTSRWRRDALGIQVPIATRRRRSARRLDVIILPLLGFDAEGHRLGMGAGYYDRLLDFKRIGARPWLVGYAYSQQETSRLPADPWDVKLDAVALSSGLRTLKAHWPTVSTAVLKNASFVDAS